MSLFFTESRWWFCRNPVLDCYARPKALFFSPEGGEQIRKLLLEIGYWLLSLMIRNTLSYHCSLLFLIEIRRGIPPLISDRGHVCSGSDESYRRDRERAQSQCRSAIDLKLSDDISLSKWDSACLRKARHRKSMCVCSVPH